MPPELPGMGFSVSDSIVEPGVFVFEKFDLYTALESDESFLESWVMRAMPSVPA